MRVIASAVLLLLGTLGRPQIASAGWDDRSAGERAAYDVAAVGENVVPVVSALGASRCLQGYILCKLSFAGLSLVAAGEQLFFSGGADLGQTKGILHRGFAGDWILTGRHAAGDAEADVLPDPGPATASGSTF